MKERGHNIVTSFIIDITTLVICLSIWFGLVDELTLTAYPPISCNFMVADVAFAFIVCRNVHFLWLFLQGFYFAHDPIKIIFNGFFYLLVVP